MGEDTPEGPHELRGSDLEHFMGILSSQGAGRYILSQPVVEWRIFDAIEFPRHVLRYNETSGCVVTIIDYEIKDAKLMFSRLHKGAVLPSGDIPFYDGKFNRDEMKRTAPKIVERIEGEKELPLKLKVELQMLGIKGSLAGPENKRDLPEHLMKRYMDGIIEPTIQIFKDCKEYFLQADPRVMECLREVYEMAGIA